jgi:predicted nucleotidyltransferase
MPSVFFPSSKTRFVNKEEVVGQLKLLARQSAKRNPNIKGIYLFGSFAKDQYTIHSDADLLIVLSLDARIPRDRIPEFLLDFADAPIPVDVFPFTVEEIRINPFLQKTQATGIMLL